MQTEGEITMLLVINNLIPTASVYQLTNINLLLKLKHVFRRQEALEGVVKNLLIVIQTHKLTFGRQQ